jgi:V/A-type H+/Na+-transporting ATPase subunit I
MIVPMKHITVVSVIADKLKTIESIRDLGTVHLSFGESETPEFRQARHEYDEIRQADNILRHLHKPLVPSASAAHVSRRIYHDIAKSIDQQPAIVRGSMEHKIEAVIDLDEQRRHICDQLFKLKKICEHYKPFGEFDPELPRQITKSGVQIKLFRYSLHRQLPLSEDMMIKYFGEREDYRYGILIGEDQLPEGCEELPSPPARLSEMLNRCAEAQARIAYITERLGNAAEQIDFKPEIERLRDFCYFIAAHDSAHTNENLVWISGWMPGEEQERLLEKAHEKHWGVLVRDPLPGEQVPTLLRPPRGFKPMQSLFSALGINPAYSEADVSVPFFCFFSIFFAMLVGDGGYGAIILLFTLWSAHRFRRAPRAPFTLLKVFAGATIVWGALSNTWLGFHPAFLKNPASAWLTNAETGNNNMMLLCFTLGVAHLSIARIWNAASLFPDSKFLAEIGWVGVLWFMYFTAGGVVGVLPAPGTAMKAVLAVSILMIALFMLKKSELKSEGANLGMLPLTIISSLGDIISYVRLFAVGLASVKVAENFNNMALDLEMHAVFKIPCMIIILLLGHALNFAMAGLSVLVHAVRLNTLEFSNHKGITWSGFAFTPFKRNCDKC